jgi:hypothetical protein
MRPIKSSAMTRRNLNMMPIEQVDILEDLDEAKVAVDSREEISISEILILEI